VSSGRRFWLRVLLLAGRRKDVVIYLRYQGLLMKDLKARRKDLEGRFA